MNGPTNSRFRTARNVFANGIRSSQGANVSLAGGSDVSNALIPRMLILGSIILIGFVALVVKLITGALDILVIIHLLGLSILLNSSSKL